MRICLEIICYPIFIMILSNQRRRRLAQSWTLPHLVDIKISEEYNRRGEKDGKAR
jgi:hypothetical protein